MSDTPADAPPVAPEATVPVSAALTARVLATLSPRKVRVVIAEAGLGGNYEDGRQWYLSPEGLESLRKIIGGAKAHYSTDPDSGIFVHASDDMPHWQRAGNAGYFSDEQIVGTRLEATYHIHEDTPQRIVDLIAAGEIGLSIEAHAQRRPTEYDGKSVVELTNFCHGPREPASVALVTNPALRGRVLRVAAAVMKEQSPMDETTTTTATDTTADTATALQAEVTKAREARVALEAELTAAKVANGRAVLANTITAAKLPEKAAALVTAHFEATFDAGKIPEAEKVTAQIDALRGLLAEKAEVNAANGVSIGTEPEDRVNLRLDNLFVRNAPTHVRDAIQRDNGGKTLDQRLVAAGMPRGSEPSVLRLFRDCTGHDFIDLRGPRSKQVKAAILTSTWADAWENVINRMFLTAYDENKDFSDWRKVTKVVPIANFVKQERMSTGGYANLSTVAEGANYAAMTSPGDTGMGYVPVKRGGTESVTWESFLRDDVGALTNLPVKMGTAAIRTLYEFVFDLLTIAGQQTMDYDSTVLYDASEHSNLLTTALSAAQVIANIKAMMNQTDQSSSKKLMIQPKHLLVPVALWNTAFDILKSPTAAPGGSTVDNVWVHQFMLDLIVVRHWTNATDWFVTADPFAFPTMEVGFINGQETPQLFVQDDVNFGSMFEADSRTYKIKHSYGGGVLRHEGIHGNDVA